jgi:hypothetical protein
MDVLLSQIERLYDSLKDKESEYFALTKSGCDYNTLRAKETNIKVSKQRLHELEELFLLQFLAKKK